MGSNLSNATAIHGWESKGAQLGVFRGMAYFLSPVDHSDTSRLEVSVSSWMQKRADSTSLLLVVSVAAV